MNKEPLFFEDKEHTETKRLKEVTSEKAIFEDGWWMERGDYERTKGNYQISQHVFVPMRQIIGWNRNEETKQLTYFFLPRNI